MKMLMRRLYAASFKKTIKIIIKGYNYLMSLEMLINH